MHDFVPRVPTCLVRSEPLIELEVDCMCTNLRTQIGRFHSLEVLRARNGPTQNAPIGQPRSLPRGVFLCPQFPTTLTEIGLGQGLD